MFSFYLYFSKFKLSNLKLNEIRLIQSCLPFVVENILFKDVRSYSLWHSVYHSCIEMQAYDSNYTIKKGEFNK